MTASGEPGHRDGHAPRKHRFRPGMEGLEGRALMSYGGTPDFGFGSAGIANIGLGGAGQPLVYDQTLQPDGKVVVAGSYLLPSNNPQVPNTTYFAVTRLNPDGSIDSTFGARSPIQGLGRVLLFGTTSTTATAEARALAIQPDGKILATGDVGGRALVVRLNPDGSLDTTFGFGGGSVFVRFANRPISQGERIALQPDGRIVVAGFGENQLVTPVATDPAVARLNADGSIDTNFGTFGQVVLSFGGTGVPVASEFRGVAGLALQPDGKIVVDGTTTTLAPSGSTAGQVFAVRLNLDGTPDLAFGALGKVILPAQFAGRSVTSENASTLAIQPDGRIILVGAALVSVTPTFGSPAASAAVPFAARLNPNGSPDTTYGGSGALVGDPARSSLPAGLVSPVGATLQADGKLLVGAGGVSGRPIFLRYRVDGSPDPSFGEAGLARLVGAGFDGSAGRIALMTQSDGKILGAFAASVARLLPRGASGDFNNDGISDPAIYVNPYGLFADRPSGGGADVLRFFGIAGPGQTLPAPGAYDGNGVTELGVYLPALGAFGIRPYPGARPSTGGADTLTFFGIAGAGQSLPAPGDYDGSGRTELAVYLPALGAFAYRPANGGPDVIVPFGIAGPGQTLPAPGDYFGTGQAAIAAYLPAPGSFALRDPWGGPDRIIAFGIAGAGQSIPMPGDYDGSGRTELAVYLPALGAFAYRPANGGPDVIVPFGIAGPGQTLPAPGDYTGVGHDELGAYLPPLGYYAYRTGLPGRPSPATPDTLFPFGLAGAGQTIPFTPSSATTPTGVFKAAASTVPIPANPTVSESPPAVRPGKRRAGRGA